VVDEVGRLRVDGKATTAWVIHAFVLIWIHGGWLGRMRG
jgi:hypothetical protein